MEKSIDRTPRVFISYSWKAGEKVLYVAEKLMANGVDVVFDKWELKEGQDKYAFMERCVSDSSIDKVLIYSDSSYAEKANKRAGGVGDETIIISSEVYGKVEQEKFIPIVAERDEEGNACIPLYIGSRIYIDFSNDEIFEQEFQKLLRNIYNKPLYNKPKLGNKPVWINEQTISHFELKELLNKLKATNNIHSQNKIIDAFLEQYTIELKQYFPKDVVGNKEVYETFVSMKDVRDLYLDFLDELYGTDCNFSDIVCKALEKIYNSILSANFHDNVIYNTRNLNFEIYKIHIWELFLCTITFLRYKGNYKDIHNILKNTFFLKQTILTDRIDATDYCSFYHYSEVIEEYKKTTSEPRKYTLLGDELCHRREKLPIYSKNNFANTDIFIAQVTCVYKSYWSWFPITYVYSEPVAEEWIKLKSKKFCYKMCDLFEVTTIEELKKLLNCGAQIESIKYPNSFNGVKPIAKCIDVNYIGIMN